jgi:hypothetical protein
VTGGCTTTPASLTGAPTPPYPVPPNAGVPRQEPGKARRPSGLRGKSLSVGVRDQRYRRRRHRKRRR